MYGLLVYFPAFTDVGNFEHVVSSFSIVLIFLQTVVAVMLSCRFLDFSQYDTYSINALRKCPWGF